MKKVEYLIKLYNIDIDSICMCFCADDYNRSKEPNRPKITQSVFDIVRDYLDEGESTYL